MGMSMGVHASRPPLSSPFSFTHALAALFSLWPLSLPPLCSLTSMIVRLSTWHQAVVTKRWWDSSSVPEPTRTPLTW